MKYTVYHGTSSTEPIINFDMNKLGKASSKMGFFFDESEWGAEMYADNVFEYEITLDNPINISGEKWYNMRSTTDDNYFINYRDRLISKGYDGVIIQPDNEYGTVQYIVFNNDDIKYVGDEVTSEGFRYFNSSNIEKYKPITEEESTIITKTDTPEFKKWFGDSKVVDENGEPLVVYHGTDEQFDEFKKSKIGSTTDSGVWGSGFYLTPNESIAKGYGKTLMELYVKIENPLILDDEESVSKFSNMMDEYITSIENTLTEEEWLEFMVGDGLKEAFVGFTEDVLMVDYDGVIYTKDNHIEIVAFNPNQIKSATNNNGNFNPNSNLITEDGMEKYDYYIGELNPLVWNGEEKLLEEVSDNLMEIVYDFVDTINGKINAELDIDDVILTGSLANLNWNKFSDFDLHILTDLEELSNNYDLNKLAVDELKNNWNKTHDIKINGYDVETYFQDVNEPHIASGVYSVLNDEWITKPEYSEELDKQVESQEDEIIALFDIYDSQVRNLLDVDVDSLEDDDIAELQTALDNMMNSIKKLRRDEEIGLNSEMGEYSIGNLAFKMLRNAGTIGELLELKNTLYDMSYSFDNEILG